MQEISYNNGTDACQIVSPRHDYEILKCIECAMIGMAIMI